MRRPGKKGVCRTLVLHDHVYGLRIKANHHIPGLVAGSDDPQADVKVWLGLMPDWVDNSLTSAQEWYVSPFQEERGEPVLRTWRLRDGGFFRLLYLDGTSFVVDSSGTEIWATWPDTLTLEDTSTYLLGPVLGFVQRLRGATCLHASGVAVDGMAIALLGPAGAGKSTTAAAMAQSGYSVLTEDVVALRDHGDTFLAQPGYPLIRLWPESVQALYGAMDALPLLTPNWDKRYLSLARGECQFQQEPLPLGAIYILSERADDPTAPFIEPIPLQEGLITLVANTYTNYLLDQTMRAREFEALGRLISHVPLRKVTPHSNIARLPDLCRAILDDFRCLSQSEKG